MKMKIKIETKYGTQTIEVVKGTKKCDYWLHAYNKSNDRKLSDVYANYSKAKAIAYDICCDHYLTLVYELVHGVKILSTNKTFFTMGAIIKVKTIDGQYLDLLVIDTHANRYYYII